VFTADILLILRTYGVLLVISFLGWPITRYFFGKLPDKGWGLGRVATILFTSLTLWQTASLGLAANTNQGLVVTVLLLVIIDFFLVRKMGKAFFNFENGEAKVIIFEEILFLFGFVLMSLIRGFSPSIDSLEKFMDFGFINRYLLSPNLPADDMWQAGKAINYYSFGHYIGSILIRMFMIKATIGYNLVLGVLMGLSMNLTFLASYYLAGIHNKKAGIVGGFIGALSVVFAGNGHTLWYIVKNRSLTGYWYAEATRFIHNTIHEFPSYSFTVADLHGHLLDLPVVLALIVLIIYWRDHKTLVTEVVMGALFGVMMMTNTWDVAVYGMVLLLVGLYDLISNKVQFFNLIKSSGVIFLFMIVTALPWALTFEPISNGIKIVTTRSELWQLAVLWLGGVVINLIYCLIEKRDGRKILVRSFALSAILLILIPEIVYAKDIYPDHPRANTMFKLTYQSFVITGVLAGASWANILDKTRQMNFSLRWISYLIVGLIFWGAMIFPSESFPSYYGQFSTYKGLDGARWMEEQLPERYKAAVYLMNTRDGKNMVEAVGDSYTLFNAISVYSGVPTVQGWRVHEWLWRGGYDTIGVRESDVRNIYEGNNTLETEMILKKYNVGWILNGEDERSNYKVNRDKLIQLGESVWRYGETEIIKVN